MANIDELYDETVADAEAAVIEVQPSTAEEFDRDIITYRHLRDRKDELNAHLKKVNSEIDEVEARILATMEARDQDSVRYVGIGTIFLTTVHWPKVLEQEQFIAWLDENGHSGIARRTVNSNTLRSWVKETKERGEQLPPPDLMEDKTGREVRIRRA